MEDTYIPLDIIFIDDDYEVISVYAGKPLSKDIVEEDNVGKFCAIAKGVEFVMNGANHRMDGVTTYPFYVIGGDWGSAIAPVKDELPLKGDTIVGNDVWIGQHVTIMPGVHIGDGAIIGANSVVASDIPPYAVAVGNPCRVVRKRFDDEFIAYLLELKWWDWNIERIEANFEALSSGDLSLIRKIDQ